MRLMACPTTKAASGLQRSWKSSGAHGAMSASPSRATSTHFAISPLYLGRCSAPIHRYALLQQVPTRIRQSARWACPSLSPLGSGPSRNIAAYRRAYRLAGHRGRGGVWPIYVGETGASARGDPEQSIMGFYKTLGQQVEESATRAGARAIKQRSERGQMLQTISYRRRSAGQGDRRNAGVGD